MSPAELAQLALLSASGHWNLTQLYLIGGLSYVIAACLCLPLFLRATAE